MNDLYRLVYTSFRKDFCNELEMKRILELCKKNNPLRGVTGVLLHSNSRFIQYMEGRKVELEKLFEIIKKDERHTSINERSFEPISERVFPSWEMGYKDFSDSKIEYHTHIPVNDVRKFQGLIGGELDFKNDGLRLLQTFFRS